MTDYIHYPLFVQNKTEAWFTESITYLKNRYFPILERTLDTFRFVELDPRNKSTFSYEYSSLLRDAGSVFSSVLDDMLRNLSVIPRRGKKYDIIDYSRFLLDKISDIQNVGIILNVDFEKKYVYPFTDFTRNKITANWWAAFNNVKHNELLCRPDGCLSSVIYCFSALSILYDSVSHHRAIDGSSSGFSILTGGLFSSIVSGPKKALEEYHFPQVPVTSII